MGQPNFKRLAELGQLPDYAKPIIGDALTETNQKSKEAKVEKQISNMNKQELVDLCEEKGFDTEGTRKVLIERIQSGGEVNVIDEEVEEVKEEKKEKKNGEFVDDLLE